METLKLQTINFSPKRTYSTTEGPNEKLEWKRSKEKLEKVIWQVMWRSHVYQSI